MSHHIVSRTFAATAAAGIVSLALALPASAMPLPDPGPESAPNTAAAYLPPDSQGGFPIIPVGVSLLAGVGIGAAAVTARTARRQAHEPASPDVHGRRSVKWCRAADSINSCPEVAKRRSADFARLARVTSGSRTGGSASICATPNAHRPVSLSTPARRHEHDRRRSERPPRGPSTMAERDWLERGSAGPQEPEGDGRPGRPVEEARPWRTCGSIGGREWPRVSGGCCPRARGDLVRRRLPVVLHRQAPLRARTRRVPAPGRRRGGVARVRARPGRAGFRARPATGRERRPARPEVRRQPREGARDDAAHDRGRRG